jgi:hypothetical protein
MTSMAALPNSAAHRYAGFQLRDVPALHAKLRRPASLLHNTQFQLRPTHAHSDLRTGRELDLHGFYLVGPFMGYGTVKEPFWPWESRIVWAIYGGIYFLRSSKATGRTTLVTSRT